ncbi:MAG: outer membrane beta-barrel protein [Candidatus Eiseniibacteriota bacterium]
MLPRKRIRWTLAACAGLALAGAAEAGDRGCPPSREPWRRGHVGGPVGGYAAFKAGGYGLDAATVPDEGLGSLFLGAEAGATPSPFVQIGFTLDWLRRRDAQGGVLPIDAPFELPVEGVIESSGSSTDLIPFGGIVRVRFPVSDGRLVPFLAGQLTYDILRLEHRSIESDGTTIAVHEQTEYFHGTGTSIALGLEAMLDRNVGLLFEVGTHDSVTSSEVYMACLPVDGRVVGVG